MHSAQPPHQLVYSEAPPSQTAGSIAGHGTSAWVEQRVVGEDVLPDLYMPDAPCLAVPFRTLPHGGLTQLAIDRRTSHDVRRGPLGQIPNSADPAHPKPRSRASWLGRPPGAQNGAATGSSRVSHDFNGPTATAIRGRVDLGGVDEVHQFPTLGAPSAPGKRPSSFGYPLGPRAGGRDAAPHAQAGDAHGPVPPHHAGHPAGFSALTDGQTVFLPPAVLLSPGTRRRQSLDPHASAAAAAAAASTHPAAAGPSGSGRHVSGKHAVGSTIGLQAYLARNVKSGARRVGGGAVAAEQPPAAAHSGTPANGSAVGSTGPRGILSNIKRYLSPATVAPQETPAGRQLQSAPSDVPSWTGDGANSGFGSVAMDDVAADVEERPLLPITTRRGVVGDDRVTSPSRRQEHSRGHSTQSQSQSQSQSQPQRPAASSAAGAATGAGGTSIAASVARQASVFAKTGLGRSASKAVSTRGATDSIKTARRLTTLITKGESKGDLNSESAEPTTAVRLWGVVRSVVMVDFEHPDVAVAFKDMGGGATYGDPARYIWLWKAARMHFIRSKLLGEWFPAHLQTRPNWFYLDPVGPARRIFDSVLLILVLFNAYEVPFNVGLRPRQNTVITSIDTAITCFFFLDVVLNFFTALAEAGRSGQLTTDLKTIAGHYVRGWFLLDLTAAIPFDVIVKAALGNDGPGRLQTIAFLKTPRLLRLSKLLRFFEKLRGASYFKVLKLTFLIAMCAHWVACAYCLLAQLETSSPTWVDFALAAPTDSMTYIPEGSALHLYADAFYQAWTMLTGNGANVYTAEERFFVSCIMMLGGFVQAIIVGNIALVVTNRDAAGARFRAESEFVISTAKYLELPSELQGRIHDYYEFMQTASHPGPDGMHELTKLPKKLYEDIVLHMNGPALDSVPLLRGLEPSFVAELSLRVSAHILLAGEAVFGEGDISREMYFVVYGTCDVENEDGRAKIDGGMLSTIEAGSFFGELALIVDIRRTTTVRATTVCDINILTRANLIEALAGFPEVEDIVRGRGRRRLLELRETGWQGGDEKHSVQQNGPSDGTRSNAQTLRKYSAGEVSAEVIGRKTWRMSNDSVTNAIQQCNEAVGSGDQISLTANLPRGRSRGEELVVQSGFGSLEADLLQVTSGGGPQQMSGEIMPAARKSAGRAAGRRPAAKHGSAPLTEGGGANVSAPLSPTGPLSPRAAPTNTLAGPGASAGKGVPTGGAPPLGTFFRCCEHCGGALHRCLGTGPADSAASAGGGSLRSAAADTDQRGSIDPLPAAVTTEKASGKDPGPPHGHASWVVQVAPQPEPAGGISCSASSLPGGGDPLELQPAAAFELLPTGETGIGAEKSSSWNASYFPPSGEAAEESMGTFEDQQLGMGGMFAAANRRDNPLAHDSEPPPHPPASPASSTDGDAPTRQ